MDWYEEWFGHDYKLVYPHRDEAEAREQIGFVKRHINIPERAKVLDLCCGCGRHAIELWGLGYDVVGLDLSEELLDLACSRADECEMDVQFIRCDMREIPYEDHFDLIVNFFTSFGYFADDADNQRVLLAIAGFSICTRLFSRSRRGGTWLATSILAVVGEANHINVLDYAGTAEARIPAGAIHFGLFHERRTRGRWISRTYPGVGESPPEHRIQRGDIPDHKGDVEAMAERANSFSLTTTCASEWDKMPGR